MLSGLTFEAAPDGRSISVSGARDGLAHPVIVSVDAIEQAAGRTEMASADLIAYLDANPTLLSEAISRKHHAHGGDGPITIGAGEL